MTDKYAPKDVKQTAAGPTSPANPVDEAAIQDLARLIHRLSGSAHSPLSGLGAAGTTYPDIPAELNKKGRLTVAFPPCASELLAHFKSAETDDVTKHFKEYFKFDQHFTMGQDAQGELGGARLAAKLDPALSKCLGGSPSPVGVTIAAASAAVTPPTFWPSDCCICEPCVTLNGERNWHKEFVKEPTRPSYRRLFLGDVVWLFYFDRMGVHQILGAILDSYAYTGRLPISNGSLEADVEDDITALVLEVMVRQVKIGLSSTQRDRTHMYRQVVAWTTDVGRKLNPDSAVNESFNVLFHKFIFLALELYRDRRLAVAIQGAAADGGGRVSQATMVAIAETLELLKKRFETFHYGRNYYNTLSGIVWTLASLGVLRSLVNTLGIPRAMNEPHEFVPAAYDLLVLKRPVTSGETNRYIVHRDCAENGRDILLDMEVIDHSDTSPFGQLDTWINVIEPKVEAYRSAYRAMTGVDLGTKSPEPIIEQKA